MLGGGGIESHLNWIFQCMTMRTPADVRYQLSNGLAGRCMGPFSNLCFGSTLGLLMFEPPLAKYRLEPKQGFEKGPWHPSYKH